jgi:hypothetical protein
MRSKKTVFWIRDLLGSVTIGLPKSGSVKNFTAPDPACSSVNIVNKLKSLILTYVHFFPLVTSSYI